MENNPVIKSCYYALCHTPDLVRYGSKPRRELAFQPALGARLAASLRSYHEAVSYPPNQTFIGNLTPDELAKLPRPWFKTPVDLRLEEHKMRGYFGEILDQESFYGLLQLADVLQPSLSVKTFTKSWSQMPRYRSLCGRIAESGDHGACRLR